MSKHNIDDVEEMEFDSKLTGWKVRLIKFEKLLKMRNLMILAVTFYFLYVVIIPELLYIATVQDIYYFGYFNERAPRLASTTNEKLYFQKMNIPFYRYEDLVD